MGSIHYTIVKFFRILYWREENHGCVLTKNLGKHIRINRDYINLSKHLFGKFWTIENFGRNSIPISEFEKKGFLDWIKLWCIWSSSRLIQVLWFLRIEYSFKHKLAVVPPAHLFAIITGVAGILFGGDGPTT